MSDFCAIVNPLASDEALLFWVTQKQMLALEYRRLNDRSYDAFVDNFDAESKGFIEHQGHIAAIKKKKSFAVYGYTGSFNNTNTVFVSQISPIINPLASSASKEVLTNWRTLAATTDGDSDDWVYFFTDEPNPADKKNVKRIIVQFHVNSVSSTHQETGEHKEMFNEAFPRQTSKLAALYDPTQGAKKRHTVFFQREGRDDSIFLFTTDTLGPSPVSKTLNATDGTPIAALIIPHDGPRVVHLYYVDKGHTLRRSKCEGDDLYSPKDSYEVISGISQSSDLTAVWDATNKTVQLFCQTEESNGRIIQVSDDPANHS